MIPLNREDKLSLILLLSKISLHNYHSKVAIQSCNLLKNKYNAIGKLGIWSMIQKIACLGWQSVLGSLLLLDKIPPQYPPQQH
jgi:hypothetical protein